MEYLYRGWLLESSRRLSTFNESLHRESATELGKADQELRWLVHVLVDRGRPPNAATSQDHDVQYLTAARESAKTALGHADVEIAVLKQFPIGQAQEDNRGDKSEAVRVAVVL